MVLERQERGVITDAADACVQQEEALIFNRKETLKHTLVGYFGAELNESAEERRAERRRGRQDGRQMEESAELNHLQSSEALSDSRVT